jgi:YHS domain-containing protein
MKRMLFVWLAACCASGVALAGDEPMKHEMKTHQMMQGEVALGGYCPVAYSAMGKAVKGDPMYASQYMGHTFHFANADAKKMFDADPAKYVVSYDGFCATAAAMGKKVAADPTLFSVFRGRVYLFSSAEAKAAFDKDPAGTVAKADRQWPHLAEPTM